jgi:hypothetical protein
MALVVGRTGRGFPDKILRASRCGSGVRLGAEDARCGIGIAEAVMSIVTGEKKVAVAFDAMVQRHGEGLLAGCDGRQDLA